MKKQQHKQETVRLTIDFPVEQHAYLKMLAAKQGISMRQYVIESLSEKVEQQEAQHINLSENKFKKALKKIITEDDDILKRLADS